MMYGSSRRTFLVAALAALCAFLSMSAFAKPSLVVYSCDPAGSAPMQKIMDKFAAANDCEVKFQVYPSDQLHAGPHRRGQRGLADRRRLRERAGPPLHGPEGHHPGPDQQGEILRPLLLQHAHSIHLLGEGPTESPPTPRTRAASITTRRSSPRLASRSCPLPMRSSSRPRTRSRSWASPRLAMGGGDIYMWPMWFFQTFAQTSKNRSFERTVDSLLGKAKFTDPGLRPGHGGPRPLRQGRPVHPRRQRHEHGQRPRGLRLRQGGHVLRRHLGARRLGTSPA